ncbi:MAG: 30S ribosomal protein S14 [Ignavibacteriae bacterium]|nr:30S ribosomal protein S14 [Ignavibacteriota bacterium]MCB9242771.1 30S ribosomal protein S14 [Ignavibacteriales bacterium]
MARKSLLARQAKRERMAAKYAAKRKELKEKGDYEGLQKLPRNSSPTRLNNRCNVTGRVRSYYRKFGVSRLVLREFALQGKLPGVVKSSW